MQQPATLFQKIKDAAKNRKNVVYLDTNIVGKMSVRSFERHKLKKGLDKILSHETTTTETQQIMREGAMSQEVCLSLLKQHRNILFIPEVLRELEGGLRMVEYLRNSISDLKTPTPNESEKSKEIKIAQRLYKTLKDIIDFAWRNNCQTNLSQTEEFQRLYGRLNKQPNSDINHTSESHPEKYGSVLGTDDKLIATVITEIAQTKYNIVYLVSADKNLLKRAELLAGDLSHFNRIRLKRIVP